MKNIPQVSGFRPSHLPVEIPVSYIDQSLVDPQTQKSRILLSICPVCKKSQASIFPNSRNTIRIIKSLCNTHWAHIYTSDPELFLETLENLENSPTS